MTNDSVPDFGAETSRGRGRIGVVVPVSNTNLEPDLMLLRPQGVSLHFARAGGYDLDQVPNSDQMRQFAESSLESVIGGLKAALVDVFLYGCTSATLAQGLAFDREFQDEIERLGDCPAVTAAGALVEALADLRISRFGFCSPYTEQLNDEAVSFLTGAGFQPISRAYVGEDLGNYGQGALTPEEVYRLALRADSPRAQAIVLSCTDMRAVEAIEALEQTLGKPVVTSNQALMHAAIKRLPLSKTDDRVPGALGLSNSPKRMSA